MWLSRQMRPGAAVPGAELGVTSISGGQAGVVTRGEARKLPVYGPGGYVWQPASGGSVLVIKGGTGGEETCVAGAKQAAAPEGFAQAYLNTPLDRIRAYSTAQFDHWTREPFSANFRKMLTLEQYRDARLAQLYQENLASGPVKYMAAIFRPLTDSDETAMQLALDFYGPMYLLYSVYDGAADQSAVAPMLEAHIDRFIAKLEGEYRKKDE